MTPPLTLQNVLNFLNEVGKGDAVFFSPGMTIDHADILDLRPYFAALGKFPFSVLVNMSPAPLYNVSRNIHIITEDGAVSRRSVLAHPAVRLFIGEGGGQQVIESVFHRVPMLFMPSTTGQVS